MTERQRDILTELGTGRKNAITKKTIAMRLGLAERRVEQEIRELVVQHGLNICSSCRAPYMGYFIAANEQELRDYKAQLLSRIREENARLFAVDKRLAEKIGQALQEELFNEE